MPAVVSILYPREADATFDFDYYMNTHMPLVSKLWTKHGMTGWHVCKLDSDSPYIVHAVECAGQGERDCSISSVLSG